MQNLIKRIIVLAALVLVIVLAFKYCEFKKEDDSTIDYNTNLIQQQILNVGKLVVTEGHFSEVITYKNQQKYLKARTITSTSAAKTIILFIKFCIPLFY